MNSIQEEMKQESLLGFIRKEKLLEPALYDCLRYELDKHVYYYGEHFKYPNEKAVGQLKSRKAVQVAKQLYMLYRSLSSKKVAGKTSVVSNAYFNFNDKLRGLGYEVISPSWAITKASSSVLGGKKLIEEAEGLRADFIGKDFQYLITKTFIDRVQSFSVQLQDAFLETDVRGIVVPNDESFFENLSLKIFSKIARPSFIFLHGLPGRYNHIDENRSDYLIVWGPKIKDQYIKAGFKADKVLISGHPYYSMVANASLRFDFSNIQVLAKIAAGSPHSVGMNLYDRGNLIVYLLSLQKVLQGLQIPKVRLRLHPSCNPEWFYKFLDRNFFLPDQSPLADSLKASSLVIGPTSSVFLEAIAFGVNYCVYEPSTDKIDLFNERLVPPFDGSDDAVPLACDGEGLREILMRKKRVLPEIFNEYISSPFNIDFLKDYIG